MAYETIFDIALRILARGAVSLFASATSSLTPPPEVAATPRFVRELDGAAVSVELDGDEEARLCALALVPGQVPVPDQEGARLAEWPELSAATRATLGAGLAQARCVCNGRAVLLRVPRRSLGGSEDLDAAIVVVAELARRGMEAVHALRELPGAEYDPPRGAWDARTPPRVRLPASDVTFELRAGDGGGACTVAWTEIAPSGHPLPLPPPLVRDGSALLYRFDAVEIEPARLVAAAELLRSTAAALRAERYG